MRTSRRVLVLALDAASPRLLRAWARDGTLPNIAGLMATGLVGQSRSVEGLYDGSTWPSFSTGLNPASHGFHWLDQLRLGTYRMQTFRPADFARTKALWDFLSAAGRRVAVLDVPLTPRSRGLNGVQLVEWGCHDAVMGYRSTPASLARDVLREVGPHPAPEPCDAPARSPEQYRELAERLARGAAAKARMTVELLAREQWDFAIQVFSESHCGGHQLWHLHDDSHPGFDPAITQSTGDLIRYVYQALDMAIGQILERVDGDTTVVLLDLHAMAVPHGANLILPDILQNLGVMRRPPQESSGQGVELPGPPARKALRAAYHRLPDAIRRPFYEVRQRINQRLGKGSVMHLDSSRSLCFDIPIGSAFGAVRLNLKGREPDGQLAPGSEAEQFSEKLTAELLQLSRPDTGQRWVQRVLRTGDLYRGKYAAELPDLLIEWNPAQCVGSAVAGKGAGALLQAHSPRLGLVEQLNTNCRTGQHEPEGMFVVRGPGFGTGSLNRVASVMDFAPTFARWLGCELPAIDGTPIAELL